VPLMRGHSSVRSRAARAPQQPSRRSRRVRIARVCVVAGAVAVGLVAAFWAFRAGRARAAEGRLCQAHLRAVYLLGRRLWPGKQPRDWGRIEDLAQHYRRASAGWITDEEFDYLTGRSDQDIPEDLKRGYLGDVSAGMPWVCPSDPRRKEARGQGEVIKQLPPSYQWKPVVGILAKCPIHHLQLLDSGDVREGP